LLCMFGLYGHNIKYHESRSGTTFLLLHIHLFICAFSHSALPCLFRQTLGPTQPPLRWVTGVPSPRVNRQERKADHPLPSTVEIKKTWMWTSTLLRVLLA
jgi:hypothetical protein